MKQTVCSFCLLLLTACGGMGSVTPNTPSTPVPPELVGEWQDPMQLGPRNIDLYDPATDRWLNEYEDQGGTGIRFTEDGGYVWGVMLGISNGFCRTTVADYHRGTVVIEGTTLTLYPQVHREMYNGGCTHNLDYNRDASLEPQTYTWQVGPLEDGRLGVGLQEADGEVRVYAQR